MSSSVAHSNDGFLRRSLPPMPISFSPMHLAEDNKHEETHRTMQTLWRCPVAHVLLFFPLLYLKRFVGQQNTCASSEDGPTACLILIELIE